jgi:FdhE protein
MSKETMELQSVSEDVVRLRRERPHARAFVDPFVGLLLARPGLVAGLVDAARRVPDTVPDVSRLGLGGCLEPRDALPLDEALLRRVFDALHQLLTQGFPAARTDLLNIGVAATRKEGFLLETVRDLLADRGQFVLRAAHALGVEARTLNFWGVQLLTPIAMARGRVLKAHVTDAAWNRGYCPVCGSWPGISRVKDGIREMTCSFCETTWRFVSSQCPFCETSGVRGQTYAMPGFATERVVVCRRCNHYLAEIEGDPWPGMSPEVAALALAPLELLARQQGHAPASLDWRQTSWA